MELSSMQYLPGVKLCSTMPPALISTLRAVELMHMVYLPDIKAYCTPASGGKGGRELVSLPGGGIDVVDMRNDVCAVQIKIYLEGRRAYFSTLC